MQEPPVPHKLKDIDEKILKTLDNGRNVPSNLAESLDVSRQWVTQRLQQMESADYVRNVGRGVYELQSGYVPDDDRDRLGLGGEPDTPTVDIDTIRRALDDIEAACERRDGETLQAALQRARDAMEADDD